MSQEEQKRQAAQQALEALQGRLTPDTVLGVGSGSTVACFIALLEPLRGAIDKIVAASESSAAQLRGIGLPVCDLNEVHGIDFYIDGADQINEQREMLKGGGAALTREKILAAGARQFLCIADKSKVAHRLNGVVVLEVIPMARSQVAREMAKLGATPVYRQDCITDNGNHILDVRNLPLRTPREAEQQLNNIPGVVCNGIFALRPADQLFLGE